MSSEKPRFGLTAFFADWQNAIRGFGKLHNSVSKGSLSSQLANTAVEPLVVIDREVAYLPELPDILLSINELVACMYFQVASRLTALDIDGVRVTRILEKLATQRDVLASLAAMESEQDFISAALSVVGSCESDKALSVSKIDGKQISPVIEAPNLAVGKMLLLEFKQNGQTYPQPVSIRLNPVITDSRLMIDLFDANYEDYNIIRRIKLTSYGEKSLADALFSLDAVRRKERLMLADPEGIVRNHYNDALKDVGYSAVTGEIPLNRASSVMVMSQRTADKLNSHISGALTKFKARQRYFEGTASTMIVVIDPEEGMVDVYLHDFKNHGTYSIRSLERNGKSGNNNLTPMVKDLINGQIPSFS